MAMVVTTVYGHDGTKLCELSAVITGQDLATREIFTRGIFEPQASIAFNYLTEKKVE